MSTITEHLECGTECDGVAYGLLLPSSVEDAETQGGQLLTPNCTIFRLLNGRVGT